MTFHDFTSIYLAAFIPLFSLFFIWLSWHNTKWALAFAVAFLPSYLVRFHVGPLPMTLLEVMVLILFAVWAIKTVPNSKLKIIDSKWRWPVILWLLAATVAVFFSPDKISALGIWKAYFLEPILFFVVFVSIVKDKRDVSLILQTLGFSALYVSAFAIWQKFTGLAIHNPDWQAEATRRVTSVFEYPNAVGLFLAPIVILLIGYFFSKISHWKSLSIKERLTAHCSLLAALLSLLAVFFAQSEGALIGIAAGLIILALFGIARKLRPAARKVIGASFSLVVILLLAYPFLLLKFEHPYQPVTAENKIASYALEKAGLKDLSGEIRKQGWRETLAMLGGDSRWLRGAGLDGYQAAVAPYHHEGIFYNFDRDPDFARKIVIFNDNYKAKYWQPVEIYLYPHNIILNFYSELSLFGLIVFLWIVAKFFALGFKKIATSCKLQATSYVAAMAALIIHGLVDVPYFKNDLSILFWLIIGLMIIAGRDAEK